MTSADVFRWAAAGSCGVALVGVVLAAVWAVRGLLVLVLVALFVAVSLDPAVRWLVRHRRIRLLPWLGGFAIGLAALLEQPLGLPAPTLGFVAFFWAVGLSFLAVAVMGFERLREPDEAAARRADVILLGFGISFLPSIAAFVAQIFLRISLPVFEIGFVLTIVAAVLTLVSAVSYMRAAWPDMRGHT